MAELSESFYIILVIRISQNVIPIEIWIEKPKPIILKVAGRFAKSYKTKIKWKTKLWNWLILVGIMVGGLSIGFNPYDELSLLGISIYKLIRLVHFWVC
jgi:hypothetical protein